MKNREDILSYIDNYINKNNIKTNLKFWIPNESNAISKRLRQNISYKISDADYIVQLYKKLNIIVVWKNNSSAKQSYSRDLILKNLENGKNKDYKGSINHFNNQTIVYFSTTNNFNHILNLILK